MNALCLVLFCTEPKKSAIVPIRALRRTRWAMDQIELALRKPESVPGKNLNDAGYCSVVLIGPDNAIMHTERFDEGYTAVICPDGNKVEVTEKEPKTNATAAMKYLDIIARYCAWAELTCQAMLSGGRVPLLEGDLNREELHRWVGHDAYAYFQVWKSSTRVRAAAKAVTPSDAFDEELLENVQNLKERTAIAPSGYDND